MPVRAALVAVLLLAFMPGAAFASLADEQNQGQTLVAQVRSGVKACGDLSKEDFDHIGEYVMWRAVGSTRAHEALNQRMTLMMGAQAESRMHQLMGARAVGCSSAGAAGGAGSMMGGTGMMGSGTGSGGWGPMMRSSGYAWMSGGAWQHMSRQDWQRLQHQWFATGSTAHHRGGWSALAIIATVLAALLLGAAITVVRRRPSQRPPAAASPS